MIASHRTSLGRLFSAAASRSAARETTQRASLQTRPSLAATLAWPRHFASGRHKTGLPDLACALGAEAADALGGAEDKNRYDDAFDSVPSSRGRALPKRTLDGAASANGGGIASSLFERSAAGASEARAAAAAAVLGKPVLPTSMGYILGLRVAPNGVGFALLRARRPNTAPEGVHKSSSPSAATVNSDGKLLKVGLVELFDGSTLDRSRQVVAALAPLVEACEADARKHWKLLTAEARRVGRRDEGFAAHASAATAGKLSSTQPGAMPPVRVQVAFAENIEGNAVQLRKTDLERQAACSALDALVQLKVCQLFGVDEDNVARGEKGVDGGAVVRAVLAGVPDDSLADGGALPRHRLGRALLPDGPVLSRVQVRDALVGCGLGVKMGDVASMRRACLEASLRAHAKFPVLRSKNDAIRPESLLMSDAHAVALARSREDRVLAFLRHGDTLAKLVQVAEFSPRVARIRLSAAEAFPRKEHVAISATADGIAWQAVRRKAQSAFGSGEPGRGRRRGSSS